jgi:putative transposase
MADTGAMDDVRLLHRHSIRLPGRDYTRPGWYFLTICCGRRLLFGSGFRRSDTSGPFGIVRNRGGTLSPLGGMLADEWVRLGLRFPWAEPSDHVVMPDHFHGLVYMNDGTGSNVSTPPAAGVVPGSIPHLVQAYKSTTTWRAKRESLTSVSMGCGTRLWQRNYYESIIRDGRHLAAVRKYIANNPARLAGRVPMAD